MAVSAMVNDRIGASRYKGLFTKGGVMSSLKINFKPSASGCQMPNGPTREGPQRFCMCATTLRSANVVYATPVSRTNTAITILISDTRM